MWADFNKELLLRVCHQKAIPTGMPFLSAPEVDSYRYDFFPQRQVDGSSKLTAVRGCSRLGWNFTFRTPSGK